jgi:hypothetical protein
MQGAISQRPIKRLVPAIQCFVLLLFLLVFTSVTSYGSNLYVKPFAGTGAAGSLNNGGPATLAQINAADSGVWVDSIGNVFIADQRSYRIRVVSSTTGSISIYGGTGATGSAGAGGFIGTTVFWKPFSIVADVTGRYLYISDMWYVWILDLVTSMIAVFVGTPTQGFSGDGDPAGSAQLNVPRGLWMTTSGVLYIVDSGNFRVRKVSYAGIITTFAGNGLLGSTGDGGPATLARLNSPCGIFVNTNGVVYISDSGAQVIRRVVSNIISTFVGTGMTIYNGDNIPATLATLSGVSDVKGDTLGNIYIAVSDHCRIRKVDSFGIITTFLGNEQCATSLIATSTPSSVYFPVSLWLDSQANLYFNEGGVVIRQTVTVGSLSVPTLAPTSAASPKLFLQSLAGLGPEVGGIETLNRVASLAAIAANMLWVDSMSNIYFCDDYFRIRKIDSTSGILSVLGGTGATSQAGADGFIVSVSFKVPYSIFGNTANTFLYICDKQYVWKYVFSTGIATVITGTTTPGFSGDNGPAGAARLQNPLGIWLTTAGDLYIADSGNHRIRKISASGIMTTVVGGSPNGFVEGAPTTARLNTPYSVCVEANSGKMYIADTNNYRIRLLDASPSIVSTFAGNGAGVIFTGDYVLATLSLIGKPKDVKVDGLGNVFFTSDFRRVLMVNPAGILSNFIGTGNDGFTLGVTSLVTDIDAPIGIWIDSQNMLYFSDSGSIRKTVLLPPSFTTPSPNSVSTINLYQNKLAGGYTYEYLAVSVPATSTRIYSLGFWVGSSGMIYYADPQNFIIRKVSVGGIVTNFGGTGPGHIVIGGTGPIITTQFDRPSWIVGDTAGNYLYICDRHFIWKCSLSTGIISSIAGTSDGFGGDTGPAVDAQFWNPSGIWITTAGDLYIADSDNNCVRKISTYAIITTVAGTGDPFGEYSGDGGPATLATLYTPVGIYMSSVGLLYIADTVNSVIRLVGGSGIITTFAGSGATRYNGDNIPASLAAINRPNDVKGDRIGNIYVADTLNCRIRIVDTSGIIATLLGDGVCGLTPSFSPVTTTSIDSPQALWIDSQSNLYFSNNFNSIHKTILMTPTSQPSALPSSQPSSQPVFVPTSQPSRDPSSQPTSSPSAKAATFPNLYMQLLAGTSVAGYSGDNGPATLAQMFAVSVWVDPIGNMFVPQMDVYRIRKIDGNGIIVTIGGTGLQSTAGVAGPIDTVGFYIPRCIVGSNTTLYISDGYYVWRSSFGNGFTSVFVGNGVRGFSADGGLAVQSKVDNPQGLWLTSSGVLYFAEFGNNLIRKIVSNYIVTVAGSTTPGVTFAGDNGPALAAYLNGPLSIFLTTSGDKLFIADSYNHRIRVVDSNHIITTFAGTGETGFNGDNTKARNANLNTPYDVKGDTAGNIYIADSNFRVRMVNTRSIITTLFGTGVTGFSPGITPATSSALASVYGLWLDSNSNLYICDKYSIHRSVVLVPTSQPSSRPTGQPRSGPSSQPSRRPSCQPTSQPNENPTSRPSSQPSCRPSSQPSIQPTGRPRSRPSSLPSCQPSCQPSSHPSGQPSTNPSSQPSRQPLSKPSSQPSGQPSSRPTCQPSSHPSGQPSKRPSSQPSCQPSCQPSSQPSGQPKSLPTSKPTFQPTSSPSGEPMSYPNLFMKLIAGSRIIGSSGDDGPATDATIVAMIPWVDSSGDVYIPEYNSCHIRRIDSTGIITTFGGTGAVSTDGSPGLMNTVSFYAPYSIVGNSEVLYISDYYYIWKYSVSTNYTNVVAGESIEGFSGDNGPASLARLNAATGLWLNSLGVLFIADTGNHRIRTISVEGIITTVAGSGPGSILGDTGPATLASLNGPLGVYMNTVGKLFIADQANHRIRVVDTNNIITTFAGTGSESYNGDNIKARKASLSSPADVKGDVMGNIYIADMNNDRIRIVDKNGIIRTVFGTGFPGFTDGISHAASSIGEVHGIWVDSSSTVYFSDMNSIHRSVVVSSPTSQPSQRPSSQPTSTPTSPTTIPTTLPTDRPSSQPTGCPSSFPTAQPTDLPSSQPTARPSQDPSAQPTVKPSSCPTGQPTALPSDFPTSFPSTVPTQQPTGFPSSNPSEYPSVNPSGFPSGRPSCQPSSLPSGWPSRWPTVVPTVQPSSLPSSDPSGFPTRIPSSFPTLLPSSRPSVTPSSVPTGFPSRIPSSQPSVTPTSCPSGIPSSVPSSLPSVLPSVQPSSCPTVSPSGLPSLAPSAFPSSKPTKKPSNQPTGFPTGNPTMKPSSQPVSRPSCCPSGAPSLNPSSTPSIKPIANPTAVPTAQPTSEPSSVPSSRPSSQPTCSPSRQPSSFPTATPTEGPTSSPSVSPTIFKPIIESTIFSNDGRFFSVSFEIECNSHKLNERFFCDAFVDFSCSKVSLCEWISERLLRVEVSLNNGCVKPDDTITAVNNATVCWKSLPLAKRQSVVSFPLKPLVPILSRVIPEKPSVCSNLTFDLRNSSGNLGRAWSTVKVLVGGSSSVHLSDLQTFIRNHNDRLLQHQLLEIPNYYFRANVEYNFTVTLCNFIGGCATKSFSMNVVEDLLPGVTILRASSVVMTRSQPLLLIASLEKPKCGDNTVNGNELRYNWTVVRILSNSNTVVEKTLKSSSNDPARFSLSAYSLLSNRSYEVTVRVSYFNKYVDSSVLVRLGTGNLQSIIEGNDHQTMRVGGTLKLDGGKSYDQDKLGTSTTLLYSWTCSSISRSLNVTTCKEIFNSTSFESSKNSPVLLLKAREIAQNVVVNVTLTITDTETKRTDSGTVLLTVLPSLYPLISLSSNIGMNTKLNPSQSLQLSAVIDFSARNMEGNVTWRFRDNNGRITAATPLTRTVNSVNSLKQSVYLALLPNSLVPGQSYSFELFYQSTIVTTNSITINVNAPPGSGTFAVSPSSGIAYFDVFSLSCQNWIDTDLPLSYQFSYLSFAGITLITKSVTPLSHAETILPEGLADRKVIIQADVFDSLNANTTAYSMATVIPLLKANISQLVRRNIDPRNAINLDDLIRGVNIASSLLNQPNCTLSPNCTGLNRFPCLSTSHTCGPCQGSFFSSNPGDGNELCVKDATNLVINNHPKKCYLNCSDRGSCIYSSHITGKRVENCFEGDLSCFTSCACSEGYKMSNYCEISDEETKLFIQLRDLVVDRIIANTKLQDPTEQVVSGWMNSLLEISQIPDQISEKSLSSLLNLTKRALEAVGERHLNPTGALSSYLNGMNKIASVVVVLNSTRTRDQRRKLQDTSVSYTEEIVSGLRNYAGLLQLVPGQSAVRVLEGNFRFHVQNVDLTNRRKVGSVRKLTGMDECGQNELIALPQSLLEKGLKQKQTILTVPTCTHNSSSLQLVAMSLSSGLYGSLPLKSNPIVISFSSIPCTSSECNAEFTFASRNTDARLVSPAENQTVHCEQNVATNRTVSCASGKNYSVYCNGNAMKIVFQCPSVSIEPTCQGLLGNGLVHNGCKVKSFGKFNITCSCPLVKPAKSGSSVTSTVPSSADITIVSLLTTVEDNFVSTILSTSELNEKSLAKSWQAMVTISVFLGGIILFMGFSVYADKRVMKKISAEEKMIEHAKVHSVYKQKLLINRKEAKGNDLFQLAKDSLPSILFCPSLQQRIWDQEKKFHRWLGIIYYFSAIFPRILRVVSLASNIIIMLFIQSLTYNYTHGDDGSCELLTTEETCVAPRSYYGTGGSLCYWQSTTSAGSAVVTDQGECKIIQPENSIGIMLFVAVFSGLVSAPLAVFIDWIVNKILAAPETSTTVAVADLNDSKNLEIVPQKTKTDLFTEQRPSAIRSSKTIDNSHDQAKIDRDYQLLTNELVLYREVVSNDLDHCEEFDRLWALTDGKPGIYWDDDQSNSTAVHHYSILSQFLYKLDSLSSRSSVRTQSIFKALHQEFSHLYQNLEKETIKFELLKTETAKSKRLLFLFQKDLIPGITGEILESKEQRDNVVLQPVSSQMKMIGWIFLGGLDLGMLFYVFLFAVSQDSHRQVAWGRSLGIYLFLDIVLISTVMVIFMHVLLPSLIMRDVGKIKKKMIESIERFYEKMDNNGKEKEKDEEDQKDDGGQDEEDKEEEQHDHEQPLHLEKRKKSHKMRKCSSSHQLVKDEKKTTVFNAAKYLFLSYHMAELYPDLSASQLILQYSSPWPKQDYKHIKDVKKNYSGKFTSITRAISIIVIFFLTNLLASPIAIQDMIVQMATTAMIGYTVLIHIQLYFIAPALVVIPTLSGILLFYLIRMYLRLKQKEQEEKEHSRSASVHAVPMRSTTKEFVAETTTSQLPIPVNQTRRQSLQHGLLLANHGNEMIVHKEITEEVNIVEHPQLSLPETIKEQQQIGNESHKSAESWENSDFAEQNSVDYGYVLDEKEVEAVSENVKEEGKENDEESIIFSSESFSSEQHVSTIRTEVDGNNNNRKNKIEREEEDTKEPHDDHYTNTNEQMAETQEEEEEKHFEDDRRNCNIDSDEEDMDDDMSDYMFTPSSSEDDEDDESED